MLLPIAVAIPGCAQVYKISRQNINIFRDPCAAVGMPPNSRLLIYMLIAMCQTIPASREKPVERGEAAAVAQKCRSDGSCHIGKRRSTGVGWQDLALIFIKKTRCPATKQAIAPPVLWRLMAHLYHHIELIEGYNSCQLPNKEISCDLILFYNGSTPEGTDAIIQ